MGFALGWRVEKFAQYYFDSGWFLLLQEGEASYCP